MEEEVEDTAAESVAVVVVEQVEETSVLVSILEREQVEKLSRVLEAFVEAEQSCLARLA